MCDVRRMALRNEREHDKKVVNTSASASAAVDGDHQEFKVVDKKAQRNRTKRPQGFPPTARRWVALCLPGKTRVKTNHP